MAIVAPSALSVKLGIRSNSTDMLVQTVNITDWNDWAITATACNEVVTSGANVQRLFTSVFSLSEVRPQPFTLWILSRLIAALLSLRYRVRCSSS